MIVGLGLKVIKSGKGQEIWVVRDFHCDTLAIC